jgi:hypothetical protein
VVADERDLVAVRASQRAEKVQLYRAGATRVASGIDGDGPSPAAATSYDLARGSCCWPGANDTGKDVGPYLATRRMGRPFRVDPNQSS